MKIISTFIDHQLETFSIISGPPDGQMWPKLQLFLKNQPVSIQATFLVFNLFFSFPDNGWKPTNFSHFSATSQKIGTKSNHF